MSNDDFRERLIERLLTAFDCTRREAERIADAALAMKEATDKDDDDFEVTVDLVISKLETAPERFSPTGKWNWWAGSIRFFDEKSRSFKLD